MITDSNEISMDNMNCPETVRETELEVRTPEIVAAEIRQIASQTIKMVLNNSIEIGKRLCEAKEMVAHGEWGEWLEKSVNFKQSTANNLMRIYVEYGESQGQLWGASAKSQAFGNLTYSKAVALLAVPPEEREAFVEKNDVENISTRELQEAIKAREDLEKEKTELEKEVAKIEIEAEKAKQDIKDLKKRLKAEKEEAESKLQLCKDDFKEQQSKQNAEIDRLKAELEEAEEKSVSNESKAEIEHLKQKLNEAKEAAIDENITRFKFYFKAVQDDFTELLAASGDIANETAKEKRKMALKALLQKFIEIIEE
uniref:DUF3102 domain-containing protein n=1 Tax=Caudovirales sp. ctkvU4 TaxID=2826783 RepID=A0A8S5QQD8_9CAUD|nr:MAG TPA: Protein of unknown function (DUF3102) [Caudovirales sp. ctkvU4]